MGATREGAHNAHGRPRRHTLRRAAPRVVSCACRGGSGRPAATVDDDPDRLLFLDVRCLRRPRRCPRGGIRRGRGPATRRDRGDRHARGPARPRHAVHAADVDGRHKRDLDVRALRRLRRARRRLHARSPHVLLHQHCGDPRLRLLAVGGADHRRRARPSPRARSSPAWLCLAGRGPYLDPFRQPRGARHAQLPRGKPDRPLPPARTDTEWNR